MDTPKTIYLKDYQPCHFSVEHIRLEIALHEGETHVNALSHFKRVSNAPADAPLRLDGEMLTLIHVLLDGTALPEEAYEQTTSALTIPCVPDEFSLTILTTINPEKNTALSGLYKSAAHYCTQCEPHGFRRITYFLDRPDVMTHFTTRIEANRSQYPILLSNGNVTDRHEDLDSGRHAVEWEDPFKKPCYLFALVAGDFDCLEDHFVTMAGRKIALKIFVEKGELDKTGHAMKALKQAMKWDEVHYGLEYDLDIFMIVAVRDFNMGAMENKGLNIFNSKYILAKPETATDQDYEDISSVVAHEYFHNWSGNRVTCRDWFQLSLKEGLTVFRDQEFSADTFSRSVIRIKDVNALRSAQFAEDASPMAHPVRPESYVEMNNFYTLTVYNKGAELIRMLHTLLGYEDYRKGTNTYFERHDGQAVTCDDFVAAMQTATKIDLTQFKRWYRQAGTPELQVSDQFDASEHEYLLTLRQSCPPTPGQPLKQPFYFPMTLSLLDGSGEYIPLQLQGEKLPGAGIRTFPVSEIEQTFKFINVPNCPTPSLLKGFSAPIKCLYEYSDDALIFLMTHEKEGFSRWEAASRLGTKILKQLIEALQMDEPLVLEPHVVSAYKQLLTDKKADKALLSLMLTLPSEDYLSEQMDIIDVDAIHQARTFMRRELAAKLQDLFIACYEENHHLNSVFTPEAVAQRAIKNVCLAYLSLDASEVERCFVQFESSTNMTDTLAALSALANVAHPARQRSFDAFYQKWRQDDLVMDKWFSVQATSCLPNALDRVYQLLEHPDFSIHNPNRVCALIGAFSACNPIHFHRRDGAGYRLLIKQIKKIDPRNPHIAARLMQPFTHWQCYDDERKALMNNHLETMFRMPTLSRDVYEILEKIL